MQSSEASSQSWDCHVHVLDPKRFPYRQGRTYTPYPALLPDLVHATASKGIVIVQASVEDGPEPLLYHLKAAKQQFPDHIWRGSVISTTREDRNVALMPQPYLNDLHAAGVRSVRIQSGFGSFGSDQHKLQEYVIALAQSYCIESLGWSISIQQSLQAWASMAEFIQRDGRVQHVRFVAEHNGSATPEVTGTPDFDAFLALLQTGRLWVKISALHRRSPGNIYRMKEVVTRLVQARPDQVVFGSDWPHTNPAAQGTEPQPPLQDVDTNAEMEAVRTWVGDEIWQSMLTANPLRLYG
jgi:predicted TIM-barrel fold metal-dependent hydrolase